MLQAEVDMGMIKAGETAREILKEARDKMEKGGQKDKILAELYGMVFKVGGREMFEQGIRKVITMIEAENEWETAYYAGFEYGYQTAIKDMAKRIKEMKTYGGGYKKVRAGEMPERAGRAKKPVQREV